MGDKNKTIMVLLHGYGGSGCMFWKIIKRLSEHYNLYLLDVLGMGASSRPEVEKRFKRAEEADDYLAEWLERWRVKIGIKDKFILSGHSFGGYISGVYAIKYHHNLLKLQMLSPAGVPKYPENFDIYKEFERFPRKRRPPKCVIKIGPKIWSKHWSPFGVMRGLGRGMAKVLLKGFVRRRFMHLSEKEAEDYKMYLHQTLLRKGSTEYLVFVVFDWVMFAHRALEEDDRLGGVPIPVSFFYGDRDWMNKDGGYAVVSKNPFKGTHSKVYLITNSDHHMYFDNPEEFVETMIEDLSNLNEIEEQK